MERNEANQFTTQQRSDLQSRLTSALIPFFIPLVTPG
jgi:hypothetical protein